MKIKTDLPYQFATGELLTPTKINKNLAYMREASNVFDNRYQRSIVSLPLYLGTTGLTQANDQSARSFLIYAPLTFTIESVSLSGSLASGSASLYVYSTSSGTTAPSGHNNPILTPTTTSQTLVYGNPITITQGSTFRIELSGTTFTTSKLDLVLSIRSDRFLPNATDTKQEISYTNFTESSTLDASAFNTKISSVSSVIANNYSYQSALKIEAYSFINFVTTTDTDLLRREIVISDGTKTLGTAYALYQHASYTSNGAAGNVVTSTLQNASGTATGLATSCTMTSVKEAVSLDTSPTVALLGSADCQSDTAKDYRLVVSNNSATNCVRSTVWLYTI